MCTVQFKFPFTVKLTVLGLALWVAFAIAPPLASAALSTDDFFVDHRTHMASVAQPCQKLAVPTDAPAHTLSGCALACSAVPAGALLGVSVLSLPMPMSADAAPRSGLSLQRTGRSLVPEPFPPRFASPFDVLISSFV